MAAPVRKSSGITLDDVDASLEPVAPEELEEGFDEGEPLTPSQLEEGGLAPLRRIESLELLPSDADQPRAVPEGRQSPRRAPAALDPWLNDRRPMTWRQTAAALVLVPPRVILCLALAAGGTACQR